MERATHDKSNGELGIKTEKAMDFTWTSLNRYAEDVNLLPA